jgi:hypothetical protein
MRGSIAGEPSERHWAIEFAATSFSIADVPLEANWAIESGAVAQTGSGANSSRIALNVALGRMAADA